MSEEKLYDKESVMKNRNKTLLMNISLETFEERLKLSLANHYLQGRFFDIPRALFNESDENDKRILKELKRLFVNNKQIIQYVPDGLYDFRDSEQCDELRKICFDKVARKQRLSFGPMYEFYGFTPQEIELFKNSGCEFISIEEYVNLYSNNYSFMDEIRLMGLDFGQRRAQSLYNEFIKLTPKSSMFDPKLLVKLSSVIHGTTSINGQNLSIILSQITLLDELLVGGNYFNRIKLTQLNNHFSQTIERGTKEFNIDNFERNIIEKDSFENKRKRLFLIMELLKKTGALNDLVVEENYTIAMINKLLKTSAKIEYIDEQTLFEEIGSYDVNSVEDLESLLTHNRNFANKLAHVYDDYMYTTLFIALKENEEIFGEKSKNNIGLKDKYVNETRSFISTFFKNDYSKLKDFDPIFIKEKEEFISKILSIDSNYLECEKISFINKEEYLSRIKIKALIKPTEKELKDFPWLIDVINNIENDEKIKIQSLRTDKLEVNRILEEKFSAVPDDERKKFFEYIESTYYSREIQRAEKKVQNTKRNVENYVESKKIVMYGKQILLEFADRLEKNYDKTINVNDYSVKELKEELGISDDEIENEILKIKRNVEIRLTEETKKKFSKQTQLNYQNPLNKTLEEEGITEKERYVLKYALKKKKDGNYIETLSKNEENILLLENEITKNCDLPKIKDITNKDEYCFIKFKEINSLLDVYRKAVKREYELGEIDSIPSCADFIKALFYVDEDTEKNKKQKEYFFSLAYERNGIEQNVVGELCKIVEDLKLENIIKEHEIIRVLQTFASQKDSDIRLFKMKHQATLELGILSKKYPNRIYFEGRYPTKEEDGIVNIHRANVPQTNAGHNKWLELQELKENISTMYEEPEDFKKCYERPVDASIMPLNTFIVQRRLSAEQVEDFKKVCRLIGYLEGKCECSEETLKLEEDRLELLENMRLNDFVSYLATQVRFMIGAGEEYYKSFFEISDKSFSQLIIEDCEKNETEFLNSQEETIHEDEQISFERIKANIVFEDSKFNTRITYQGAIQEGIKLQNRISMQDKQEENETPKQ